MWPVHTWLPDAHVEAPTAGSVILAGVLLKMGGYGFLRFSIPMFPDASIFFAPYIFGLSIIAIIYTSLIALVQSDMKKMIAYSSVAHMGFVTIGAFSFTQEGLSGAVYQMVSHGLISGALFLCVGIIYDRLHTREISAYGGVTDVMPRFAVFFMFMMLASVGLPGTSGFVGELLVLVGIWKSNPIVAIFTASGLILGAVYMLWLYRRVMFGKAIKEEILKLEKMSVREISLFVPITALVFMLGIYATPLLNITNNSINNIFEITEFHKNQNLVSQIANVKGF
jgi:NADH-quinone oxidoreductase subunit M